MRAYYNETDPFKAEVLREAIKAGAIAPGDVDQRSIEDVGPAELVGYTQCHFFAGGGFWSLALRLAGWPDERPVWTGSCPCPSFSAAGKGQGFDDPRHLWPAWARLIRECRPPTIFGEQVSSAIGHGWLNLVQTDLEAQDYAIGKVVFGACGVGAPHIRQRLYFGATCGGANCGCAANAAGLMVNTAQGGCGIGGDAAQPGSGGHTDGADQPGLVADAEHRGLQAGQLDGEGVGGSNQQRRSAAIDEPEIEVVCEPGLLADADGGDSGAEREQQSGEQRQQPEDGGAGGVAESLYAERWPVDLNRTDGRDGQDVGRPEAYGEPGARGEVCGAGPVNGWWAGADWIGCRDGKFRPVEPGSQPLAHGSPVRVGRLRLYGDAICVPAAQAFIESYLEIEQQQDGPAGRD